MKQNVYVPYGCPVCGKTDKDGKKIALHMQETTDRMHSNFEMEEEEMNDD